MRRLSSIGLSLLLLGFLTVVIATAGVPRVTGTRPLIIDRNSMQDVLPIGSLVYVQPKANYNVGDYISYTSGTSTITHEIVALVPNPANGVPDGLWLQTKGTANTDIDPYQVKRDNVIGVVVYHVPYVGTALKILAGTGTKAFLIILAITLWLLSRKSNKPLREMQTA
jgi:signal peptidase I